MLQVLLHLVQGAYGFKISEDYAPKYMNGVQYNYYERDLPGDRHFTAVFQVLVESKSNPNYKAFIYKVVTSSYQERNWGFAGIGSYGNNFFNYDIKTNISFYASADQYIITDYEPKNSPSKLTTSIEIGYDSSGPSISAGVSFDHSELNIISNTRTGDKIYETYYQIRGSSNYVSGEISSYGMMMFRKEGEVYIKAEHVVQYQQQVGWNKLTDAGLVKFSNKY